MLKKCIVIMVMFALVAGAAFAQATFGGQLQAAAVLFSGQNINDSDLNMGGSDGGNYTNAKFTVLFGDSKAGGRIVYDHLNVGADGSSGRFWGWLQWRPNQYFRMKIGSDEDGDSIISAFAQIVDWGFTAEAKNGSAAYSDYNGSLAMRYRNVGYFGNVYDPGKFCLGLSVFPVDGLTISLAFPDFGSGKEVTETLAGLSFVTSYKIDEVGTIKFAAEGKGGLKDGADDGADIGNLYLAFYSGDLVEGLAFELGGSYNLPHLNTPDTFGNIQMAFGVDLTMADPFGIKLRTGFAFGGQDGGEAVTSGWSIGILPSYKLPKLTIYFHAGLGIETAPDADKADYQWFINPYISFPIGSMRAWLGLQIISEPRPDDEFQFGWKIPFGFNIYF